MKACRIGTTKVKKLGHFKIFEKLFKNFRQLEIAAETNKTPPLTFWKFCVQGGGVLFANTLMLILKTS